MAARHIKFKWFRLQIFFYDSNVKTQALIICTFLILFRSKTTQRVIKWIGIAYYAICTKLPNQKVFERIRFRWHYNLFLWILYFFSYSFWFSCALIGKSNLNKPYFYRKVKYEVHVFEYLTTQCNSFIFFNEHLLESPNHKSLQNYSIIHLTFTSLVFSFRMYDWD